MTQKLALCVGVNLYGHGSDLAGCVNDASDWHDALTARGFAVANFIDRDATRDNLLAGMRSLVVRLERGDTGIITFSGHGTYVADENGDEPDGRDEALCPVDVYDGKVITDDELAEVFQDRERGTRLIFVSDSCHSGTVSRFALRGAADAKVPRVRFMPPGDFLPKKLRPVGRGLARSAPLKSSALLMAGCRDFEYSFDAWFDGRANGAFTRMALDVLPGLSAKATYRQWQAAIREQLPSQSYPQSPNLLGTSSQKAWKVLA